MAGVWLVGSEDVADYSVFRQHSDFPYGMLDSTRYRVSGPDNAD